jgi:6-pyruvoyltetrahydropterin/6-carboxytetrahydropterin synthase
MYRVAVRRRFTAFHHLIGGDWGAENTHHSHDYILEVVCEGGALDRHQYLFDISVLEKHLDALVTHYAQSDLNAQPGFEGINPSIERLAWVIAHQLAPALKSQPTVSSFDVVIWEHDSAWASYRMSVA